MDTKRICPTCGKLLTAGAPEGLCPECLLKAGLGTGADIGADTGGRGPRFTPPTMDELAAKFPQLEIIEFIGQGGMGAVYKARQKQLDRVVALKILPPQVGGAAFAERFAREARALAKLNHPHIVTLYEFGQSDGLFYFLMEFVDGVNLRQLLSNSRISPREALAIVPQICEALQFAHDSGIVHRDIKPENILLDKKGQVKIADFGVAKIIAESLTEGAEKSASAPGELTEAGSTLGTPQYMAPEQIKNPVEVDHRADIYSLGVVFYQMLTGELPSGKIEAPSSRMRGMQIDVRLDEVVLRALEKKPELRFQQASQIKTMVETIATTPVAPQAPSPETPPGFRHYKDTKLNFGLDISEGWSTFPPVHKNSPYEVLRFGTNENGRHLLIIFRIPSFYFSLKDASNWAQKKLAKAGFGNFASAETTIGGQPARILDFDRPEGDGTWSCREYFVTDGAIGYVMGFGTTDKAGMFETFDRIAKSFRFGPAGDEKKYKPYIPTIGTVTTDEPNPAPGSQKAEAEPPGYTVRIEPIEPQAGRAGLWPGYEYKSKQTLFGIPWLHVVQGFDPNTGKVRQARGIIAIGSIATGIVAMGGRAYGVLAFGGIAVGVLSFGGISAGVISFGGLAFALALAIGGCALAPVAIGGLAAGYFAIGGQALGAHVLDANTRSLNDLRRLYFTKQPLMLWGIWTIWAVLLCCMLFITRWARKQNPAAGISGPSTNQKSDRNRKRIVCLLAIVLTAALILLFTIHRPSVMQQSATLKAATQLNVVFHVRVFEADASLVDKLVPADERQNGVQPNTKSAFWQGREVWLYVDTNSHLTNSSTATGSQFAQVSPDVIFRLRQGIRPDLLVDQTKPVSAVSWQPGLGDFWSYRIADRAFPGTGYGNAFYGVRKQNGITEVKIDVQLQHPINTISSGTGGPSEMHSRFLYEGPLPQTNELVFLVPFLRHDASQHYLVTVFDFNGEANKEPTGVALNGPPFTAQLDQATVDLAFVGDEPETNLWYPDGRSSPTNFPDRYKSSDSYLGMVMRKLVFYIRNESTNGVSAPVLRVKGDSGVLAEGSVWAAPYKFNRKGYFGPSIACPSNALTANLSIGVANGPWETVITMEHSPNTTGGNGTSGVGTSGDWSGTYQSIKGTNGDVAVGCSYTMRSNWASRMVYVNGRGDIVPIHETSAVNDLQSSDTGTLLISSNEYAQITAFLVQRRRFQWAEFDNVSLQEGHQTAVELKIADDKEPSQSLK